jgi:hypothetical protein
MVFEMQEATQFQKDNYGLHGSDIAIMISVNGSFVAWIDDYGSANIVDERFADSKEILELIVSKIYEMALQQKRPVEGIERG